jgi:hypothetical protein
MKPWSEARTKGWRSSNLKIPKPAALGLRNRRTWSWNCDSSGGSDREAAAGLEADAVKAYSTG